jgi:hypothetical protein
VESEAPGDSVTKLHYDMTDAVNVLVDCHPGGDGILRYLTQKRGPGRLSKQRAALAGAAAAAAAAATEAGGDAMDAAAAATAVTHAACVRCGEEDAEEPG